VDIYSYAYTKDPIVNGFIAQSGSAGVMPGRTLSYNAWYGVSAKLGCGGAEAGAKTVECMRGKPFAEISKASSAGGPLGGAFGPTTDGKVVFADLVQRRQKGDFIKRVSSNF
jgi:cholinesterase